MRTRCYPPTWIALAAAAILSTACTDDGAEPASTDDDALSTASDPNALYGIIDEFQSSYTLGVVLRGLRERESDIDAMAMAPGGHWIVVAEGLAHCSAGFPDAVRTAVLELLAAGESIRAIDFNAKGGWVVIGSASRRSGGALPPELLARLATYDDAGWTVRDVDLTNTGWIILGTAGQVDYWLIDNELIYLLQDRQASQRTVQALDIAFDGRWAIVSDQEPATKRVSGALANKLRAMAAEERMVSAFMFGLGDDFVLYSHGQAVPDLGRPIERIEYDLGANSKTIWQRMEEAKVPGLSIALIENNRVSHARSYGVLRAGQERHVLATTPYDLASLSKFPSVLTMINLDELRLVDLDDQIVGAPTNVVRREPWPTIADWKRRAEANDAEERYGIPSGSRLSPGITLRHLLTHTAGIRADGGGPAFAPHRWAFLPLPIVDLLLGYTCPETTACGFNRVKWVWDDVNKTDDPSTPAREDLIHAYANGNFLIAEAILRDATGITGAERLKDVIIEPLGLLDTSPDAPMPVAFEARAAWPHGDGGPIPSRGVYPWTFSGGIHASAADYARIMVLALNKGRDASGVRRIGEAAIADLLGTKRQGWGMGLMLNGTPTETGDGAFWHSGSHAGRTRTWMCGSPKRDEGIVILANAETDGAIPLIHDILDAFRKAKGWPDANDCR